MFQPFRLLFFGVLFCPWMSHALQETWETGYTKDDVTGKHVLGHWSLRKRTD
jgi:hypothetical protein